MTRLPSPRWSVVIAVALCLATWWQIGRLVALVLHNIGILS